MRRPRHPPAQRQRVEAMIQAGAGGRSLTELAVQVMVRYLRRQGRGGAAQALLAAQEGGAAQAPPEPALGPQP